MEKNMVSIITPCYNGAQYISETIESVLNQTYRNWEMIVIDDGSQDDSADIVRKYEERDDRIHLVSQKNAGSAAARNNGIRRSVGQYIALLDADDVWFPEFLEKQILFLQQNKAVCVCCSYSCIDAESKETLHPVICKEKITLRDMMITNHIGCLSGLYDSEKYGKIYLKEELASIRDDYAYWIDIVKLEGVAYGNTEILAKYRVLSNSTTGNKLKLIKKQYVFYRNYLNLSFIKSLTNLVYWGIRGIKKYR